MTLSRVPVAQLQSGDRARSRRAEPEFVVAGVFPDHGGWRVVTTDGSTRRFAHRAAVLVATAGCAGQTDLLVTEASR